MRRTTRPARARWRAYLARSDGPDATLVFGAMRDKDVGGHPRAAAAAGCARDLHDGGHAAGARRRRARGARATSRRHGAPSIESITDRRRGRCAACRAGATRRRRRIHLSGRPPAWYSSLIPRMHERARIVLRADIRCCGPSIPHPLRSSLESARRCVARARRRRRRDHAICKDPQIQNLTGIRFPVKNEQGVEQMRMMLTGTPERPVQIDCDDMQLFGRSDGGLRPARSVVATGNVAVRVRRQPHRRRAARVRHQDADRHVLQRGRHVSSANRVDRSLFGTQEPDAYVLGRGDPQARAGQLQDRPAAVHDLRPADAALGDGRRIVTLKVDDYALLKNRSCGQGRAGDVPADLLLPDPGGRSRHRVPAADLRHLARSGDSRSATRSSGRSAAARTRPSRTTGSRRPARASAANTATCSAPGTAATHSSTCSNEQRGRIPAGRRRRCERPARRAAT